MNKIQKWASSTMRYVVPCLLVLGAFCAHAEGEDALTLITSAQTSITAIIAALVAACITVYGLFLGLRAVPMVYRNVAAWFTGKK